MLCLNEHDADKIFEILEENKLRLKLMDRALAEMEKLLRVRINVDGSLKINA